MIDTKRSTILSNIAGYTYTGISPSNKRRAMGLIDLKDIDVTPGFPILEIINGDEAHQLQASQQLSGFMTVRMAVVTDGAISAETHNTHMNAVVSKLYEDKTQGNVALSTVLSKTESEQVLISAGPVVYKRSVQTFTIQFDDT